MKRPARPPAQLSESLHYELNVYALAAAAAGVGVLALAQSGEAKIIYTPAHVVIHRGWPGILPLDLNHDGTTDFNIENWWNSDPDGNVGFLSVLPAQGANGVWGYSTGLGLAFWASALRPGVKVGPKGPFFSPKSIWMDNTLGGPWNDVRNRYLGLKFSIKGRTHFGWARLNVSRNAQNYKITATLTGYAYETIPDKPIIAGKTHGKDEATLGRLAQGASGLSAWR